MWKLQECKWIGPQLPDLHGDVQSRVSTRHAASEIVRLPKVCVCVCVCVCASVRVCARDGRLDDTMESPVAPVSRCPVLCACVPPTDLHVPLAVLRSYEGRCRCVAL